MITPSPLQDEIVTMTIRELGLEELSDDAKLETISTIDRNIFERIIIEILRILPDAKHAEFRAMIGTASPLRIHTYLEPYIGDFPALVERVAKEEVEAMKKLLAQG